MVTWMMMSLELEMGMEDDESEAGNEEFEGDIEDDNPEAGNGEFEGDNEEDA
jgi:hypothetical protein